LIGRAENTVNRTGGGPGCAATSDVAHHSAAIKYRNA
jgi:hypothetical protein